MLKFNGPWLLLIVWSLRRLCTRVAVMFTYRISSCYTSISLLVLIGGRNRPILCLDPWWYGHHVLWIFWRGSQWVHKHLLSCTSAEPASLFFLTMVGYDMAPQREGSHSSALICRYWSSLMMLWCHRLIIRSFPVWVVQLFALLVDCFLCHQTCLCLPQWNRGREE